MLVVEHVDGEGWNAGARAQAQHDEQPAMVDADFAKAAANACCVLGGQEAGDEAGAAGIKPTLDAVRAFLEVAFEVVRHWKTTGHAGG